MYPADLSNVRQYLFERSGRLSQIGGISAFTHADGRAKGVSTLRVRTSRGLEFWIAPDRGMDIAESNWRGRSLCWHSPVGIAHPAYYSNRGTEWLKTFSGGLLSTCGLTTAGKPSEDEGEILGLHGAVANTPAEAVQWSEEWLGDDCRFTIAGQVREVSVLGHNLLLKRTITTSLNSSQISIRDVVENQGIRESPLMMLYHFNFGFPLLTERSRIFAPSSRVEPATDFAAQTSEQWESFEPPAREMSERVYFHEMAANPMGKVNVVLVSDDRERDFGICLEYGSRTLPQFTQWKMPATNHYVLGLEPGNCGSLGRAEERRRGSLQMLLPGTECEFNIDLQVLDGVQEVADAIKKAGKSRINGEGPGQRASVGAAALE